MVFAMVLLSFHFPEGASAKWRRIPMLQMEWNTVFVLVICQERAQQ
jgi:hypothetical protein